MIPKKLYDRDLYDKELAKYLRLNKNSLAQIKKELREQEEAFHRRNYVYTSHYVKCQPIYEVSPNTDPIVFFEDLDKRYKHFQFQRLSQEYVYFTHRKGKKPCYNLSNIEMRLCRIVKIGYKPTDDTPPCDLYQFILVPLNQEKNVLKKLNIYRTELIRKPFRWE